MSWSRRFFEIFDFRGSTTGTLNERLADNLAGRVVLNENLFDRPRSGNLQRCEQFQTWSEFRVSGRVQKKVKTEFKEGFGVSINFTELYSVCKS